MQGSGHLLAFVRQNRQQQLQKRSGRSSDKIGKKNLAHFFDNLVVNFINILGAAFVPKNYKASQSTFKRKRRA